MTLLFFFRPKLGAQIIPLELKLSLYVKVFFFLRFDKLIWHYPGRVFDLVKGTVTTRQPDTTEPHFSLEFSSLPDLHANPAWALAAKRVKETMRTSVSRMRDGFKNRLRGA